MQLCDHAPVRVIGDIIELDGDLMGPFTFRQNSINGYEVVGGDGKVAVWVIGEENANRLVDVMNAAYEHGKFV